MPVFFLHILCTLLILQIKSLVYDSETVSQLLARAFKISFAIVLYLSRSRRLPGWCKRAATNTILKSIFRWLHEDNNLQSQAALRDMRDVENVVAHLILGAPGSWWYLSMEALERHFDTRTRA